jgi:hypothetical protein
MENRSSRTLLLGGKVRRASDTLPERIGFGFDVATFGVAAPLTFIIHYDLQLRLARLVLFRIKGWGAKQKPSTPLADNKFHSGRKRYPIPEIAQLIAEADPYRERAPPDSRLSRESVSEGHDEADWPAAAPQVPAGLNGPEQTHDDHDDKAHGTDDPPNVRRPSLVLMIAMTGLALLGAAGALGYREIFGVSVVRTSPPIITAGNEPNKVAPGSDPAKAEKSGDARQGAVDTTGSIEKLVSREEQPVTIIPPKGTTSRAGEPPAHVAPAADPREPPPNAGTSQHLAAIPITPAEANNATTVTSPVLGDDYAVQVTSQRSEGGAQAALRELQAKYPNQLRGRKATIRRADLGAGRIYYRALVGPFASAEKAAKLCNGLKAAGGACVILKN